MPACKASIDVSVETDSYCLSANSRVLLCSYPLHGFSDFAYRTITAFDDRRELVIANRTCAAVC